MHKIASPSDLQSELHRILSYARTSTPSRQVIASELRDLADRVAAKISVGDRVEAGRKGTDDYDKGRVVKIRGRMADVAWDSGVTTPAPVSDLRPL